MALAKFTVTERNMLTPKSKHMPHLHVAPNHATYTFGFNAAQRKLYIVVEYDGHRNFLLFQDVPCFEDQSIYVVTKQVIESVRTYFNDPRDFNEYLIFTLPRQGFCEAYERATSRPSSSAKVDQPRIFDFARYCHELTILEGQTLVRDIPCDQVIYIERHTLRNQLLFSPLTTGIVVAIVMYDEKGPQCEYRHVPLITEYDEIHDVMNRLSVPPNTTWQCFRHFGTCIMHRHGIFEIEHYGCLACMQLCVKTDRVWCGDRFSTGVLYIHECVRPDDVSPISAIASSPRIDLIEQDAETLEPLNTQIEFTDWSSCLPEFDIRKLNNVSSDSESRNISEEDSENERTPSGFGTCFHWAHTQPTSNHAFQITDYSSEGDDEWLHDHTHESHTSSHGELDTVNVDTYIMDA